MRNTYVHVKQCTRHLHTQMHVVSNEFCVIRIHQDPDKEYLQGAGAAQYCIFPEDDRESYYFAGNQLPHPTVHDPGCLLRH